MKSDSLKITFVQTGGTIDKDYPKSQKGWAFEISEPAVRRIIQKLNPSFQYEILSFCKKDSLEITKDDRTRLKVFCSGLDSEKIIITHGTDTLIETASFLSNIDQKTIVLTGAMRPERFSNSDASINVGIAIGAVLSLQSGIYVAMHGLVLPYNQISRDPNSGQFIEQKS
ncbi:asparaginase domain-containing protein [bacterium]|jgi:L-asparaginase|nr:asparaginase domain-containing protein [Bacteroidota bacterium]MDA7625707.1 asparaginase domain-containing protein [bacterium]MDF1864912.1 asparaginase domain-containing protein [Saprospiraceae bacterium]